MDAIIELIAAIIGAIIRLCIQLVAAFVGAGVLASRRSGIARWGFLLIALSCAYFIFGILRFFVAPLATPGLYGLYTAPVFIGAIVVFFVGAVLTGATRQPAQPPQSIATEVVEETSKDAVIGFGVFLAVGIFVILTSTSSTAQHQRSLRETACDIYEGRVSEVWRDRASEARDLAERLLNRQIAPDVTCSE